jgi:hypothetical protein
VRTGATAAAADAVAGRRRNTLWLLEKASGPSAGSLRFKLVFFLLRDSQVREYWQLGQVLLFHFPSRFSSGGVGTVE